MSDDPTAAPGPSHDEHVERVEHVEHVERRMPIAPFVVAGLSVVAGLLFWILLSANANRGATAETPLLDQPAPAATGVNEDGSAFELSRRKGSWVVLNFFTHDCVPCIQEHPALVDFVRQQRTLGGLGAEFYSIVQNSSRDEVDEYFEKYGGDWPIVYDDEYDFQLDFGVVQVPETWIIDPNGIVRARWIGEVEANGLSTALQTLRERFSAAGGGLG